MSIPIREIIKAGSQLWSWVNALREALGSRDEERVTALLPDELRSALQLQIGRALAEDIALQNRRAADGTPTASVRPPQVQAGDDDGRA